jgi:predicted nuclease of predicted toxin-antitoxin system
VRIVLDACVPAGLARFFPDHDVTTVSKLFGTSDLDDRVLLKQLDSRCDAFVTVDKGIAFQQNLRYRPFPVVLLRAHSNSLEYLVPLVPRALAALRNAQPGDILVVGV